MKTSLRLVLLVVGVGAFAWYLSSTDLESVFAAIARLGWLAPLVLIPYALVYHVDTLAWSWAFSKQMPVAFWTLFRIRWSGEALNNVLPSAYVGGEALKVYLLQRRGVSVHDAASSVVVSKTAQTLAQLLFISGASLAFLLSVPDQHGWHTGMGMVLICGLAVVAILLWLQQRGLFGTLLVLVEKLGIRPRFLGERRTYLREIDRDIAGFYSAYRGRFFLSAATFFGGWLLDTLEIFLVAHLMGMPVSWWQALIVEAFTGVAKALGMWIPGSLGVQESGIIWVGRAAGLQESLCLAYALVRRAREMIFAAAGWLLLYVGEIHLRELNAGTHFPPND